MNFAFPALVIFTLVLPGFIFRTRFRRAERVSIDYSPFGQSVAAAIMYAAALHMIWGIGVTFLSDYHVRFDVPVMLVSGSTDLTKEGIGNLIAFADEIFYYLSSMMLVAYFGPSVLQKLITKFRLDRRGCPTEALARFHAPWYYLLTTRDFNAEDEPAAVVLSAVVELGSQAFLFVGTVNDFHLTPDGSLDRVHLHLASRRRLADDRSAHAAGAELSSGEDESNRYYPIDSDHVILRAAEMKTMSILYLYLSVGSAQDTEPDHADPQEDEHTVLKVRAEPQP